jgi:hypothetical protein
VGTTSVTADVVVLAVVLGLLGLVALAAHVSASARTLLLSPRPELPDEDRPPVGLGRLVPVGAQVAQESSRGVVALELWLVARRRG